jgi:hypothetical protein
MYLEVLSDPRAGRASGVFLERVDRAKEAYLLLADGVDFSGVIREFEGYSLRFKSGGFLLSDGNSDRWLTPSCQLHAGWKCANLMPLGISGGT